MSCKLQSIFKNLNKEFFQSEIVAEIRWGKTRKTAKKRSSITLGSFNYDKNLITINPALQQDLVPLVCLERVIFHEMLHKKFPPKTNGAKNCIHHGEFLSFEKRYPYLKHADLWIKNNLNKLLSY